MVLFVQTASILFFMIPLAMPPVLNPSFYVNFIVWRGQGANSGSQNSAAVREIASIMQTGLRSSSSNCHNRLSLTGVGYPHSPKLKSTSSAACFPVSEREFMNIVSKGRLRSLFLSNGPRVGNGRRGSAGLRLVDRQPKRSSDSAAQTLMRLVDRQPKRSSDKARLKVLRAEDVRRVRAGPSTERDDKAGTGGDDGAGIRGDDGAGTRGDDGAGIGGDDELGIGGPDDKPGTGRLDNELSTGGEDDEGAVEPAARAFHTGARKLLRRAFLLAARFYTFLVFSSSESVISQTSLLDSSIANSGSSMMSTNRGAPSSR